MEQNLSEKKPAIAQTADFDVMGALDWKDGIATLPGSNIQVRKKRDRVNKAPNLVACYITKCSFVRVEKRHAVNVLTT